MPVDAASIMTRDVVTLSPDATVREAASLLSKHAISAAPVCDAEGALLGIVSEGDLMRPFSAANSLRRNWWLDVLAEGEELAPEFVAYVAADRRRARDLMTRQVFTATERTSLAELADLMTSKSVKRVPILRDGRVVGIVSRADLVRVVADRPAEVA